jgi:hypothetical protein
VLVAQPRRHQTLHGLSDQLVTRVAGEDLDGTAEVTNHPVIVNDDDLVGQDLEQATPDVGMILQIVHNSTPPDDASSGRSITFFASMHWPGARQWLG